MENEIRNIIDHHCGGTYEAKVKATTEILALFNVSQQRELLIAYKKWEGFNVPYFQLGEDEENIDRFLSNL